MKIVFFLVLTIALGFFLVSAASAQVLTIGQTGGSGGQALLVSVNDISAAGDVATIVKGYFNYMLGVNDRLDLGPIVGNVSANGSHQFYAGLSWNLNLIRTVVDVSFFGTAITPVNRRAEASAVLLIPALVFSKSFDGDGYPLSIYTGVSSTVPVGQRRDKVFTPPDATRTIPIGLSVNITGNWIALMEVDVHDKVNAVGLGLAKIW